MRRSRGVRSLALGITIAASGAACAAGCEAVPDIRFVEDDARADAKPGDGASSGGPEAGGDGAPTSCLNPFPGAGSTCCGSTWCTPGLAASCTPASCAECEKAPCQSGELCCARPQGALCKKTCQ